MSRILFLSQLLPYPPDAGPKVRSYYVLRHLALKHRVTLLAFSRPDDTQVAVQHLSEFCEDVRVVLMRRSLARDLSVLASSFLTGESFLIRRDFVPEMAAVLDQLLQDRQFDAIHADQLWMAQYALRAKRATFDEMLVLDEHNACFQIFQRLAAGERNPLKRLLLEREWRRLRAFEAQACIRFDHIITVTDEDQHTLQDLIHSEAKKNIRRTSGTTEWSLTTIPICVDTQSVEPVKPDLGAREDVLHLGTMLWPPNIEGVLWFAREVWPMVVAKVPQATFTIAGKNPPAEIQTLSIESNGRSSILVTGYVPDPQPYLERAGVLIVPLLSGSGMRVKIVDGWRWGLPIVSTSTGAEGIDYRDGENILIADGAEAFANAVVRVLSEPELSQQLRENGRRWVELHYDWQKVYPAWDVIYPT